jgi:hypothetical protein
MPTNVTSGYLVAERKYHLAKTIDEKIAGLEEMIREIPKHKGTEHMRRNLTHKLATLKKEKLTKKRKGSRYSLSIPKEGFQVVIIGFPNSGKSTLLNKITNTKTKVSDYAFTTKYPKVGMMKHEGGRLQLIEIPALIERASNKQAELMSMVSTADGIIMLSNSPKEEDVLLGELRKSKINKPIFYIRHHELVSKKRIFEFFNLITVYTKEPREDPIKEKGIVLKSGSTVMEAAEKIHKDFVKNLKFAKVWGSSKFPGQRVEKDFILKNGDVVEFHI